MLCTAADASTGGGTPFPPQVCPSGAYISQLAANAVPANTAFPTSSSTSVIDGLRATCSDGVRPVDGQLPGSVGALCVSAAVCRAV